MSTTPTSTAAPITVTSVLEQIFQDVALPAILASAPAWIVSILGWPIIGPFLTSILTSVANSLIANGVIEIKIGIISYMDDAARTKWAAQLPILEQLQATGGTMTADQQAAFDAALQAIAENHGGIANA